MKYLKTFENVVGEPQNGEFSNTCDEINDMLFELRDYGFICEMDEGYLAGVGYKGVLNITIDKDDVLRFSWEEVEDCLLKIFDYCLAKKYIVKYYTSNSDDDWDSGYDGDKNFSRYNGKLDTDLLSMRMKYITINIEEFE